MFVVGALQVEIAGKTRRYGARAQSRRQNELSLREGFRLMSVYTLPNGVKIWVITEADRSSTCLLLREEY